MNSTIRVLQLSTDPILKLTVSRPDLTDLACALPEQSPVESFHVTLARLDDLDVVLKPGVTLPPPPPALRLKDEIRMVRTETKASCYVEVDAISQDELQAYVRACEALVGRPLFDENRIFHVTLSNADGGKVRGSIGNVWEHESWVANVGR